MITTLRLLTLRTALKAGMTCAGIVGALAAPAAAQNSEGTYQVRFGAFTELGHTTLDATSAGVSGSGTTNPFGGGVTASFDVLRRGGITYGIEGDLGVDGGAKTTIGSARFGADYFASLRGRAGFYVRPDWVLYGTGGLGFRGISVTEPSTGSRTERTLTGGVFGLGTEWHRGGTILFVEYLRSNYGNRDVTVNTLSSLTNTVISSNTYTVGGHTDAVRLGVKFKLGYDGYHDYVRDELRR